jgi:hypothetical protein
MPSARFRCTIDGMTETELLARRINRTVDTARRVGYILAVTVATLFIFGFTFGLVASLRNG